MRKTKKQNGGNMAEAEKRIDSWVAAGDLEEILNLSILKLTSLPRLPDNLKRLTCGNNKLTSLPILPDSLRELHCDDNKLTSLPTLPENLEILYCGNNNLTRLPKLPDSLKMLVCHTNKLTTLPTLPDRLEQLFCNHNELTRLPTLPDTLEKLFCTNNKLTRLPELPNGLEWLYCDNNKLITLPTLPNSLEYISCEKNNLPEIFYREENENIEYIEDDETGEEILYDLLYVDRIRKLQKSKTNITNSFKPHITEKKRNAFANTTFKNMPKNVVKQIANYLNEKNLENIDISLKPSNIAYNKKRETMKKHKK